MGQEKCVVGFTIPTRVRIARAARGVAIRGPKGRYAPPKCGVVLRHPTHASPGMKMQPPILRRSIHTSSCENIPRKSMLGQTPTEESLLLEDSDCSTHDAAHHISSHIALRVGAAMYSFAVLGLFSSSVGVMLQPLSQHYSLDDLHVSLIFIVGPVGYVFAAQSSDFVHCTWGQRGIAFLAPALHIVGALAIAARPPFAVVLVAFAAVALGTGFLDGSWCAWAACESSANTVTGLLQGSFSVGAAAGPFLASTILRVRNKAWYDGYYVLVSSREDGYYDAKLIKIRPGRSFCGGTMCSVFCIQTRKCIEISRGKAQRSCISKR